MGLVIFALSLVICKPLVISCSCCLGFHWLSLHHIKSRTNTVIARAKILMWDRHVGVVSGRIDDVCAGNMSSAIISNLPFVPTHMITISVCSRKILLWKLLRPQTPDNAMIELTISSLFPHLLLPFLCSCSWILHDKEMLSSKLLLFPRWFTLFQFRMVLVSLFSNMTSTNIL